MSEVRGERSLLLRVSLSLSLSLSLFSSSPRERGSCSLCLVRVSEAFERSESINKAGFVFRKAQPPLQIFGEKITCTNQPPLRYSYPTRSVTKEDQKAPGTWHWPERI